jgi:quercetin dioxygenase-like cupin family protein
MTPLMLTTAKMSKEIQVIPRALLSNVKDGSMAARIYEKLVKDFSTNPSLVTFLQENSGFLSLQWIKLEHQDKINVHTHDVDTLLISCVGECLLVGDIMKVLREGDTAIIPKHFKHGLDSYDKKLFWGISLRFYDSAKDLKEA